MKKKNQPKPPKPIVFKPPREVKPVKMGAKPAKKKVVAMPDSGIGLTGRKNKKKREL